MLPLRLCLLRSLCQSAARRGAIALALAIASSAVSSAILPSPTSARPVPDRSQNTGLGTVVNGDGDFVITGGRTRRRNRFHSFESFDVLRGESVFFDGAGVENIFSRVTGGDRSNINGTLGVNGDANLFLMNPQGIVFGPGAELDLRGTFAATTADQIQFGNRGSFRADRGRNVPNAPLRVSPSAFVFNQVNNLPDIENRRIVNRARVPDLDVPEPIGGLTVDEGNGLILLGGEILFQEGYARSESGLVQIGAISEPGRVDVEIVDVEFNGETQSEFRLEYNDQNLAFADITFEDQSVVDVTGNDQGDIVIRGRNVEITEASKVCGGIGAPLACARFLAGDQFIVTVDEPEDEPVAGSNSSRPGNITIIASETFTLQRGGEVRNNVRENAISSRRQDIRQAFNEFLIASENNQETEGILFGSIFIFANQIDLQAPGNLTLETPSSISTDTFGQGNAGLVILSANDSVTLQGTGLVDDPTTPEVDNSIFSIVSAVIGSGATGDAGGVLVLAPSLEMTNLAGMSTSTAGNGNPGTIDIRVGDFLMDDSVIFSNIEAGGISGDVDAGSRSDNEGAIVVRATGSVRLENGAQLQTLVRNVDGQGDAGNIVVFAETIDITGASSVSGLSSQIFSSVGPGAPGDGGFIFLSTVGDFRITDVLGEDREGNLFRGGVDASTFGSGRAGDIFITAGGDLLLDGAAQINTASFPGATGDAGALFLTAEGSIGIENGSLVTVAAVDFSPVFREKQAGDVLIVAGELLVLDESSRLSAESTSGNGGNLLIDGGNSIVLLNQSNISTSSGTEFIPGRGGNIFITLDAAIISSPAFNSNITANAIVGDGGSILIQGPVNLQDIDRRSEDFVSTNDITASSEFGAAGLITFNELDVDPIRGIVELPDLIVDPNQLLVQACPGPGQSTEEIGAFYVTGRGGIPPAPGELGRSDGVGVSWVSPLEDEPEDEMDEPESSESDSGEANPAASQPDRPLDRPFSNQIEAQDWVEDENGEIWLVAHRDGAIAPPPMPDLCVSGALIDADSES